ncbi:MAG: hypothetical protein Q8M88_16825 [Phenylobacterium sp.]|uniref:hypothetical protein n=1 Tax=Phenylobacterium sp. TaxID=1871053 RepID=UPI00273431E1|nr:hypothetical protein [Phenylobacterium sp.]MDP3176095.1 hypothetical protein [Phenylobacterium sp.]
MNKESGVRAVAASGLSEDEPIERDGVYVTQTLTRGELTDRVAEILRKDIRVHGTREPRVIIASGRCRVGSTALANVFGLAGAASFYQPVKTIMRHVIQAKPFEQPLQFDAACDIVFFKETFGPYVEIETTFDPLEAMLRSGYPADRISVIGLERHPVQSYDSWLKNWGGVVERGKLLRNFISASRQNAQVERTARANGIRYAPFHYEWIADRLGAFAHLERELQLGAGFFEPANASWGARGELGSAHSAIRHFDEAEVFLTKDAHLNLDGYIYQRRLVRHVLPHEIAIIEAAGLPAVQPAPPNLP